MKVNIIENPVTRGLDFYFWEEKGRDGNDIDYVKPVKLVLQRLDPETEANDVKPTLTLNRFSGQELLKSIAELLDKKGIKPGDDLRLEGEIKATKYHLDDMRKLVFREMKNETDH